MTIGPIHPGVRGSRRGSATTAAAAPRRLRSCSPTRLTTRRLWISSRSGAGVGACGERFWPGGQMLLQVPAGGEAGQEAWTAIDARPPPLPRLLPHRAARLVRLCPQPRLLRLLQCRPGNCRFPVGGIRPAQRRNRVRRRGTGRRLNPVAALDQGVHVLRNSRLHWRTRHLRTMSLSASWPPRSACTLPSAAIDRAGYTRSRPRPASRRVSDSAEPPNRTVATRLESIPPEPRKPAARRRPNTRPSRARPTTPPTTQRAHADHLPSPSPAGQTPPWRGCRGSRPVTGPRPQRRGRRW
jgi:hypothetical protein